jgi:methylmalonyl-CoA/ethylmalonyl-CoA epimerase
MTKGPSLGGARIGQILVPVTDIERSVAFYGETLGLPLLYRFPGIAFFDAAGVRIYLASPSQDDFAGRATVYWWVDDVPAMYAAVIARGATPREAPAVAHRTETYELWLAFVDDPDGNHVGLMREVPIG